MNAKQTAKTRMILSTQAVLAEAEESYKNHEAFSEGVEELTEVILEIDATTQKQLGNSGASDSKSIAQFLLGEFAFEVAAAAFACATKAGETQLAQRFDYSRSALTKGTGLAVIARCQDILAGATELQSSLGKYGITAAKLATLKKRIDVYKKALTKPREQQANNSAATKALPKLLAKADAILDQQLDKLVVQFKESDAEFVDKYSSARIIVDIGSNSRAEAPATTTPKTTTPGSSTTPAT